MSELRECPFCGGDAKSFFDEAAGTYDVQCQICGAIPFIGKRTNELKTLGEVIERWNTRAERTCRYEQPYPYDQPGVWNTECGNHVYWNVENDDCGTPPRNCPECGGNVVVE